MVLCYFSVVASVSGGKRDVLVALDLQFVVY